MRRRTSAADLRPPAPALHTRHCRNVVAMSAALDAPLMDPEAGAAAGAPAGSPPAAPPAADAAAGIAEDAPLVLVTGITGFVASHCAYLLWLLGYRVRGTTRSLTSAKSAGVRALAASVGVPPHGLELVECPDLCAPGGWAEAAAGVQLCLHVASPYVAGGVSEEELIQPATKGVANVLQVRMSVCHVQAVVLRLLCSSCGAGRRAGCGVVASNSAAFPAHGHRSPRPHRRASMPVSSVW